MAAGFADDNGHVIEGPAGISCIDVDRSMDNAARSRRHCALLPPPVPSCGIGRSQLLVCKVCKVPEDGDDAMFVASYPIVSVRIFDYFGYLHPVSDSL